MEKFFGMLVISYETSCILSFCMGEYLISFIFLLPTLFFGAILLKLELE